jgi:hypothetical protein
MYLNGLTKYAIDFSFTENEIIFNNNSNLNPETKNIKIIIPYGIDLTNLPTLPINASDVTSYGQSLEVWADQQDEIIADTAIEKADEKTQKLKNTLSPINEDLEYNVSATKNNGFRKLIVADNI